MEKHIITYYEIINPTTECTVANGYALGQRWFNSSGGTEYLHKTDGIWVESIAADEIYIGSDTPPDTATVWYDPIDVPVSGNLLSFASRTIQVTGQTLTSGSWNLVGSFYEYELSNVSITETNFVDVIPNNETIEITKAAELLPTTLSSLGIVKIYAKNLPTGDIVVTINIYE